MLASSSAPKIRPVTMRVRSILISGVRLVGDLRRGLAEAPLALRKVLERLREMHPGEFRPEHLGEIQLRISEVPQQKVADALLAASADEQIRVGDAGKRKPGADGRRVDIFGADAARGCIEGPLP